MKEISQLYKLPIKKLATLDEEHLPPSEGRNVITIQRGDDGERGYIQVYTYTQTEITQLLSHLHNEIQLHGSDLMIKIFQTQLFAEHVMSTFFQNNKSAEDNYSIIRGRWKEFIKIMTDATKGKTDLKDAKLEFIKTTVDRQKSEVDDLKKKHNLA